MQPRKALVLGEDTRSFLTVVRSLGRDGFEVHAAPLDFTAPALRSRYLSSVHYLPLWSGDGTAWRDAMEQLLRAEHFAVVVPCTEIALLPLAAERDRFGALACLALPDDPAIAALFDKAATRVLALAHGVAVAPGKALTPHDTATSLTAEFGLPLMLKPRSSYRLGHFNARGKVQTLRSEPALAEALTDIDRADYLVESFFPGDGVGLSILADKGHISLSFSHLRIRETSAGGSYYRMSIASDPAMLSGCAAMIASLGYTGVAMFEFRRNPTDGAWVLLEVNARPWGSLPLPVALGVDFPAAWARLLLDGATPAPVEYRRGVYGRNLLPDLEDLVHNLSLTRVWEFRRALLGLEKNDTLVADDLRPGLAEIGDKVRAVTRSLAKRLPGVRDAMLAIRRGRARNRLQRALQAKPSRIEFVCAGNICRSPYAEHRLASAPAVASLHLASSGTLPRPGRPTPAHGVAEAAARGIDLSTHRSAHFTRDRAERADLVVVFDEANLATIAARYPALRSRCVLLGDFNLTGPISDPDGGDRATFTRCYERIDQAIAVLATLLQNRAK